MKNLEETYNRFEEDYNKIYDFFEFSHLSFALIVTMQNQVKGVAKRHHKIRANIKEASFSSADNRVENVVLDKEWVSLYEYSKRENIPINVLEEQAKTGLLGKIHTEGTENYVIWPKEKQQETDLLEFGKKQYRVEIVQSMNINAMVEDPEQVLALIGRYQNLENMIDMSEQKLCETCLLLYWTVFEAFVKDFVKTLFFLYPENALKKYGKNEMSLRAVFDGSQKFTDIDSLKLRVYEEILSKYEYDRENISRLIEFVKDCYLSQNTDPFSSKYIYHGENRNVEKKDIDQIRIIRNAIIHANGELSEKDWIYIDLISRKEGTSEVFISKDHLLNIFYILKSTAHNLYTLTDKQYSKINDLTEH